MLYEVHSDAAIAVGTSPKTVLLLLLPNRATAFGPVFTVVDWIAAIEGAAQATDCLVELVESDATAAGTPGAGNGAFKQLTGPRAVSLTAAQGSGGLGCTINRNYSVEPTNLTPLVAPVAFLNGGTWAQQFPLGARPIHPSPGLVPAANVTALGLRVTSPVAVNGRFSMKLLLGS
jgi:hypothetical protein